MLEAMFAETIGIRGHNGDAIDAYYARPITSEKVPSVIVMHHASGWDEWTKEATRKFAYHGYAALAPSFFHRLGPGTYQELAARRRAQDRSAREPSDEQAIGDSDAAAAFLLAQPGSNGRVGFIGWSIGGRMAFVAAACMKRLDASVNCWGDCAPMAEDVTSYQPVPFLDMFKDFKVPVMGIFGNEDHMPNRQHVDSMEEELKKQNKEFEFHGYDGAEHDIFVWDMPRYRQEQAMDVWQKVFAFFEKHLSAC